MPTETSYPNNMTQSLHNHVLARTGANWKTTEGANPHARLFTVGMYRPDHNKQYTLGYYGRELESTSPDANAFRARPMKHYRKQYGNTNNKQTHSRINLLNSFERPSGTTMRKVIPPNDTSTECDNPTNEGVLFTPDYSIIEATQFNKVTRSLVEPTQFNDYKTCLPTFDVPAAARKRTQYQSNININPSKPKYYQTAASYLQSRCKTHSQKQTFSQIPTNTYNSSTIGNNSVEFRGTNCANSCNPSIIYKPSNAQYSNQGAVSSSSRITRLKLNTIQTAAAYSDNPNIFNLGTALPNAFAYSGRPEAPFTNKAKLQTQQFYNNFHIIRKGGQGNHTTACFLKKGSQRITALQQQSKSVRVSGIGARTLNGVV